MLNWNVCSEIKMNNDWSSDGLFMTKNDRYLINTEGHKYKEKKS